MTKIKLCEPVQVQLFKGELSPQTDTENEATDTSDESKPDYQKHVPKKRWLREATRELQVTDNDQENYNVNDLASPINWSEGDDVSSPTLVSPPASILPPQVLTENRKRPTVLVKLDLAEQGQQKVTVVSVLPRNDKHNHNSKFKHNYETHETQQESRENFVHETDFNRKASGVSSPDLLGAMALVELGLQPTPKLQYNY